MADQVIDTTALSVHELKAVFQDHFAADPADTFPSVSVLSFGFKHGLPAQADLVLDCRFLPNPHFVPELKPLTGLDPAVASFVLDREETAEFLDRVEGMLVLAAPPVPPGAQGLPHRGDGLHRGPAPVGGARRAGGGGAAGPGGRGGGPPPGHRQVTDGANMAPRPTGW